MSFHPGERVDKQCGARVRNGGAPWERQTSPSILTGPRGSAGQRETRRRGWQPCSGTRASFVRQMWESFPRQSVPHPSRNLFNMLLITFGARGGHKFPGDAVPTRKAEINSGHDRVRPRGPSRTGYRQPTTQTPPDGRCPKRTALDRSDPEMTYCITGKEKSVTLITNKKKKK